MIEVQIFYWEGVELEWMCDSNSVDVVGVFFGIRLAMPRLLLRKLFCTASHERACHGRADPPLCLSVC